MQTVAELATRPQNIETLQNAGELLYPFPSHTLSHTHSLLLSLCHTHTHALKHTNSLPPSLPGVMSLLRPLLLDVVPTIQQTAALALGRLANYNDDLAEAVVKGDILPQLIYSLAAQNASVTYHQDRKSVV